MESKNSAYQACLKMLSRRNYFSFELEKKLMEKSFSSEEALKAIELCKENLLINDEQTITSFIKYAQDTKRYGEFKLRQKLLEKGAPREWVDQNMEMQYDREKEEENIKHWIHYKKNQLKEKAEDHAKIHRFLQQKGFSYQAYRKEMEEIL